VIPVIGYLHRCKEKLAEKRTYFQYIPIVDRTEYLASINCEWAYVMTVEKLTGMQVTRRAEFIRVITGELMRIASHLVAVGTFTADLSPLGTAMVFYMFRDREFILDLMEELTGARMMFNYHRFGGVRYDLPDGWTSKCREFLKMFPAKLKEYEALVDTNAVFLQRTQGKGVITQQDVVDYGITGPNARASGIDLDLRRTRPYSVYPELDFEVITAQHGDIFDRYRCRMDEMRESLKIIEQCLDMLPNGPVQLGSLRAPYVRAASTAPTSRATGRGTRTGSSSATPASATCSCSRSSSAATRSPTRWPSRAASTSCSEASTARVDILVDILRAVLFVVIAYAVVFIAALANILWERRFMAFIGDRLGPNRTGPQGLLQSVADAFKMMGKEDFRPLLADPVLFTLAPVTVMIGAVAIQLVIPYTGGAMATNLNIGIVFLVAITSFTTLSILMGGWASRNKYSLVGALRAAAQMISYEIPMLLSLLIVAMVVGSLNISAVIAWQTHYHWLIFYLPFTFLIFYIASLAELNRGPFDLPESESELVAGYATEYSGMRFGMFYLNEYAGLTIMSMVSVTLFFGGWMGPWATALHVWGVDWIGILWFLAKTYVLVSVLIWVRFSIPRLQVDQLMAFAWKILIPLGLVNILATAAIILWVPSWKWGLAVFGWVSFFAFVGLFDPILKRRLRKQRERQPVVSA
jgi:NADH-quinone oxidoreductase subunit H